MNKTLLRTMLFVLLLPLTACLTYKSIGDVTPARGTEVVATVAPRDARIGELTVHGVTRVEGRVAFADADSLIVAGSRFISQTGAEYRSIGDLLTISRSEVLDLKQKRISAWKTALAFGASCAAVAAIIAGVGPLSGFGSGGGKQPPPP